MKSFLTSVAEFLLSQERPLHQQTVVLPSRRAAIFLRKALLEAIDKPVLAPRMMSIEELIFEVSELEAVSRPELYFRLFEALRQEGRADLQFEDFNRWGRALLQDFNEIDRYLVEPKEIFDYLGDLKRIEAWNLEPGEHTRMLDDYLRFWPNLSNVYQRLKTELLQESKAWQGLAYRAFADGVTAKIPELKSRYQHFCFVGFNALNEAEEQALSSLYEAGLADFYWDVDSYYFEDSTQEAGHFMRQSKLLRRLQKNEAFYGYHRCFSEETRNLKTYAVAGTNLQAVVSAQILSESNPDSLNNTALILSDEALLPAVLNNFHPKFPKLNLSMGLSLQNTPIAGFFEILLDFPLDSERHKRKNKDGWGLYHHSRWDALLSHPISQRLAHKRPASLQAARQAIQKRHLRYPSFEDLDLEDSFGPLDPDFFKPQQSLISQYRRLANFSEEALPLLVSSSSLQEALFGFHQLFKQTADLLEQYPYLERFEDSMQFYRELLPDLSIDLRGEPLQGMQLMGWLETRCLDFDRLVILSLNEGVLPKGRSESSLIPFDVKRKFKLPTYLEKDAVFAYHFYRLMQRAKEIHLLYSTAESAVGVVEPSRFLRQIELEWPQKNAKLRIESQVVTGSASSGANLEQIPKTPALMARLYEMAEKGFSPSSLIQYLRDPLLFYYEKVLRLRPEDELMEELDLPSQGSVMHEYLEKGFSKPNPEDPEQRLPYSPKPSDDFFKASQASIKARLKEMMAAENPSLPLDQGPNLLHLESMSFMVHNFLKVEQKRLSEIQEDWEVLATETNLQGSIELAEGNVIHLHGNADRIDREGEDIHIIDYKTGSATKNKYQVSECSLEAFIAKPEAFQLPMYTYMYQQEKPDAQVKASIFSLRKAGSPMEMKIANSNYLDSETQANFKAVLLELFSELFDPNIPFKSRENNGTP